MSKFERLSEIKNHLTGQERRMPRGKVYLPFSSEQAQTEFSRKAHVYVLINLYEGMATDQDSLLLPGKSTIPLIQSLKDSQWLERSETISETELAHISQYRQALTYLAFEILNQSPIPDKLKKRFNPSTGAILADHLHEVKFWATQNDSKNIPFQIHKDTPDNTELKNKIALTHQKATALVGFYYQHPNLIDNSRTKVITISRQVPEHESIGYFSGSSRFRYTTHSRREYHHPSIESWQAHTRIVIVGELIKIFGTPWHLSRYLSRNNFLDNDPLTFDYWIPKHKDYSPPES